MYESELQSKVSQSILYRDVESLSLAITDNENAVIIGTDELEAAYTADEARQLADRIKEQSEKHWDRDNDDVIEYIRDIADVVDNEKTVQEIDTKWDEKGRQQSL